MLMVFYICAVVYTMPKCSPRNSKKKKGRGHHGGAKDGEPTAAAGIKPAPTAAAEIEPAAAAKQEPSAEIKPEAKPAPGSVGNKIDSVVKRIDTNITRARTSMGKLHKRNTLKSSVIILIGVVCNAIYLWTQGALVALPDDASPVEKLARNQVLTFLNVSTIILTVFFIYRTFRTMKYTISGADGKAIKMGILDYATTGALLTNNILVIYSNLINEETGSPAFILIIVLLCIMLLLIGLHVYENAIISEE